MILIILKLENSLPNLILLLKFLNSFFLPFLDVHDLKNEGGVKWKQEVCRAPQAIFFRNLCFQEENQGSRIWIRAVIFQSGQNQGLQTKSG